jgi:hypothetical protein
MGCISVTSEARLLGNCTAERGGNSGKSGVAVTARVPYRSSHALSGGGGKREKNLG